MNHRLFHISVFASIAVVVPGLRCSPRKHPHPDKRARNSPGHCSILRMAIPICRASGLNNTLTPL